MSYYYNNKKQVNLQNYINIILQFGNYNVFNIYQYDLNEFKKIFQKNNILNQDLAYNQKLLQKLIYNVPKLWQLSVLYQYLQKHLVKSQKFVLNNLIGQKIYYFFKNFQPNVLFDTIKLEPYIYDQNKYDKEILGFSIQNKLQEVKQKFFYISKFILHKQDFNIDFKLFLDQLIIIVFMIKTLNSKQIQNINKICKTIANYFSSRYHNQFQIQQLSILTMLNLLKYEGSIFCGVSNISLIIQNLDIQFLRMLQTKIILNDQQFSSIFLKNNDLNVIASNLTQYFYGPKNIFFLRIIVEKLFKLQKYNILQQFYDNKWKKTLIFNMKSKFALNQMIQLAQLFYLKQFSQNIKKNLEEDLEIIERTKNKFNYHQKNKLVYFLSKLEKKIQEKQLNQRFFYNQKQKKRNITYYKTTKYNGLPNLGLTCYINAFLIVLYMNKDIICNLIKTSIQNTMNNIVKQIYQLLFKIKKQDEYYAKYKLKNKMLELMDCMGIKMQNKKQQDTTQFFRKFLYLLQQQPKLKTKIDQFFLIETQNHFKCFQQHQFIKSEKSFDLIIGYKKNQLQNTNQKLTVQQMINNFFIEQLFKEFQCSNCNNKVQATKNITISKYPKILIISIQRFEFDKSTLKKNKLFQKIKLNRKINLNGKQYILKSFIVHMVSCFNKGQSDETGHYISYCRDQSDNWYVFDDDHVYQLNIINNDKSFHFQQDFPFYQTPYILLYEKV